MNKKRKAIISLICSICFSFVMPMDILAKSLDVEEESKSVSIVVDENIDAKIEYMDSAITVDTNTIIQNEVNQEITERINICKVNNEVSNTVDSINSSVENLTEQKKEKEAAIEAARIAEEEAKKKAEKEAALAKYQEDEVYLLAAIIHCEARGESYEGQVAVGAVVLNRVASDRFPNTIKDVIYQSGQFTPAGNGTLDEVLINQDVNSSCLSAAKDAIGGSNPIGDCLFFRTLDNSSGLILGNHVFR